MVCDIKKIGNDKRRLQGSYGVWIALPQIIRWQRQQACAYDGRRFAVSEIPMAAERYLSLADDIDEEEERARLFRRRATLTQYVQINTTSPACASQPACRLSHAVRWATTYGSLPLMDYNIWRTGAPARPYHIHTLSRGYDLWRPGDAVRWVTTYSTWTGALLYVGVPLIASFIPGLGLHSTSPSFDALLKPGLNACTKGLSTILTISSFGQRIIHLRSHYH